MQVVANSNAKKKAWAKTKLMWATPMRILLIGAVADAGDEAEQWLTYMDSSKCEVPMIVRETDIFVSFPGKEHWFAFVLH